MAIAASTGPGSRCSPSPRSAARWPRPAGAGGRAGPAGFGAAGIMSVNIALVRFIFPTAMIGRGVGYTALVVAASAAAGPTIGAAILPSGPGRCSSSSTCRSALAALAIAIRTLRRRRLSRRPLRLTSAILSALTFGLPDPRLSGIRHACRGRRSRLALIAARSSSAWSSRGASSAWRARCCRSTSCACRCSRCRSRRRPAPSGRKCW